MYTPVETDSGRFKDYIAMPKLYVPVTAYLGMVGKMSFWKYRSHLGNAQNG